MKKCPFCKADIEDNARFCLYCMKPLNEKEVIPPPQKKPQWWPFVLIAVLLIALLAAILLKPEGNENPAAGQATVSQADDTTGESTDDTQGSGNVQQEDNQNTTGTPNTNQNSNTQTPPVSGDTVQTPPTSDDTPQTPEQEQFPETPPPVTPPSEEEDDAIEQVPPTVEAVYTYRAARAGDDFNANYSNSGNDIVITGIVQQSEDGTYEIPETIDGKRVIAIVANAFSGSNAKTVYIPATMKTIWNYAFADCGLTDIYFRGNAIYVESNAFGSALTIHCSASCSDRNFRYYKNTAASYGATWAEWNG